METHDLLFDVDEKGIATLTFNRPDRLNALTSEMFDRLLPDLFRQVHEDDNIRLLILTGVGRGFCTGADVEERLQGITSGRLKLGLRYYCERVAQFSMGLADIAKPVIAAVNGQAAGVGFSLSLLADFRIASENAKFCAIFARRGMVPDGGMTRNLQMIVGYNKALELMMTADNIDAAEALRIGLVNQVVPPDQLIPATKTFAERFLKNAPFSLSFIKQAAQHGWSSNFNSQLEFESWGTAICRHSEDHKEGIDSFMQKRPAQFKGK
jgi:2-(1,2-epoxy-1,2-dihydrophenyl)acetyl-CoA isomerase